MHYQIVSESGFPTTDGYISHYRLKRMDGTVVHCPVAIDRASLRDGKLPRPVVENGRYVYVLPGGVHFRPDDGRRVPVLDYA